MWNRHELVFRGRQTFTEGIGTVFRDGAKVGIRMVCPRFQMRYLLRERGQCACIGTYRSGRLKEWRI